MNTKHIIGYILLTAGVLIIGYSIFASYGIFTGSSEAPGIFEEPAVQQQAAFNSGSAEDQVNAMLQQQVAKLLPHDTVSQTLNLFAWSVFAGILIFGGSQLASLGIKLLRIHKEG
jgi:hypothetical protein